MYGYYCFDVWLDVFMRISLLEDNNCHCRELFNRDGLSHKILRIFQFAKVYAKIIIDRESFSE